MTELGYKRFFSEDGILNRLYGQQSFDELSKPPEPVDRNPETVDERHSAQPEEIGKIALLENIAR